MATKLVIYFIIFIVNLKTVRVWGYDNVFCLFNPYINLFFIFTIPKIAGTVQRVGK